MTGNIGKLGGCAEGVGKAWHAEAVAYPYDENANIWFASIKSDRWAHCVLNYPNVKREEIGLLAARGRQARRQDPQHQGDLLAGLGLVQPAHQHQQGNQAIKKLELVVCMDSTITPSGMWADVLLPIATHFERHDVALPWYKGHYYIHRPKVIEPLGESKTDFQVFTELAYRLEALDPSSAGFGKRYNPRADAQLLPQPRRGGRGLPLRTGGTTRSCPPGRVTMSWEEFKKHGVYKFKLDKEPHVAFRDQIEKGEPFQTPSGKIEIFSTQLAGITDWKQDPVRLPDPGHPQVDRALRVAQPPEGQEVPLPPDHAAPALSARTRSITTSPGCARPTSRKSPSTPATPGGWASRPATRWRSGTSAARLRGAGLRDRALHAGCGRAHEGAWMDLDENGVDRAGNPDFLTPTNPAPPAPLPTTPRWSTSARPIWHRPAGTSWPPRVRHVFPRDY
jgi:anaerobic dimethyl sulfoxide reductase subunit A